MKVIIPVAGQGTRMLPLTKSVPKELLPIYNKPILQHIVFECVMAGFKEIILVSSPHKVCIESFLNESHPTHQRINMDNNMAMVDDVDALDYHISVVYQEEPLGLGHAVLCAQPLIGDDDFAVVLPDILLMHDQHPYRTTALQQMYQSFVATKQSQIMIHKVHPKDVIHYGIVDLQADTTHEIQQIMEKPSMQKAPTNFAVTGRYILSRSLWRAFREVQPDGRGEIQLTDALTKLLQYESALAFPSKEQVFDCGQMSGYAQAFMKFAQQVNTTSPNMCEPDAVR